MSRRLQKNTVTRTVAATRPSGKLVWIAWALMVVVAVMAFVPLGFKIWWIAAPLLLVAFMISVQVLARGRMAQALTLMACHILVMPPVMAFGPLNLPAATKLAGKPSSVPLAGDSQDEPPSRLTPRLLELKENLSRHRSEVMRWLAEKVVVEKESGFLSTNSEKDVDIQTRRAIQQENLWREEVFAEISRISGHPVGEIAATYARMAAKK